MVNLTPCTSQTFLRAMVLSYYASESSSDYESYDDYDESSGDEASGDESPSEDDCNEQTSPQSSFQAFPSPLTMSDKVNCLLVYCGS